MIFGLIGIGIYLTVKLKFPQFSRVIPALKKMIDGIIHKEEVEEGKMTPFQALSRAVAARVGTGNIVGVATAIAAGRPGAAFWMIVSAFFGMATIFAEAVLAIKYRETKEGELVGGPAYYIEKGLKSKVLAVFFSVACIAALGIVGIMVQSNSVAGSVSSAFAVPVIAVTVGLAIVVTLILMGGMVNLSSGAYDTGISAAEMTEAATVMTQNGFAAGFGTFSGMFLSIYLFYHSSPLQQL